MKTKTIILGIAILYLLLSFSVVFVPDADMYSFLTEEDGLFEYLTALFWLVAAILLLIVFFRDQRGNDFHWLKTRKNIFFILLAVVFFFGAGEEISWGQRIIGWQSPEAFVQTNVQKETNIHNLSIFNRKDAEGNRKSFWGLFLNFDRLFTFFSISYCLIIPILDKTLKSVRKWIRLLNLPIVPIWLGILFPINYLVSKAIESSVVQARVWGVTEVKESVFAFLFVMVASIFLLQLKGVSSRLWSVEKKPSLV